MNRWIRFVTVIMIGCLVTLAGRGLALQSTSDRPSHSTDTAIIPGTLLQVEIGKDVDARKAHSGDIFRTRLWADVRSGDKIVLPRKAIIVGHVVQAQPRTKANPQSTLTIAFDKATLKDGSELPLHAVVERVQLSPLALSSAGKDESQLYSANPGSTTNIAMPAQLPEPGKGGADGQVQVPGPTNVRDPNIGIQQEPSGTNTALTCSKEDVKLKHFATLDIRITH